MVNEKIMHGEIYYICNECGMLYRKFNDAKYCEVRCSNGKKCHANMIKNSISF